MAVILGLGYHEFVHWHHGQPGLCPGYLPKPWDRQKTSEQFSFEIGGTRLFSSFFQPPFFFPSQVCIFLLCASQCFPDSTGAHAAFGQSSLGIRENVERHLKPRRPRTLHSRHQCGTLALTWLWEPPWPLPAGDSSYSGWHLQWQWALPPLQPWDEPHIIGNESHISTIFSIQMAFLCLQPASSSTSLHSLSLKHSTTPVCLSTKYSGDPRVIAYSSCVLCSDPCFH